MQRYVLGIGASLLLFATALVSQNSSAVVGTVRDQSGAVVAGAGLTLKSAAGAEWRSATDGQGEYAFRGLSAGSYRLDVAVPGFKQYSAALQVPAQTTVRHDLMVEVGSTSDSVTVTGEASMLKMEAARVGAFARGKAASMSPVMPNRPYQIRPGEREYVRGVPGNEQYGHYIENEFRSPGDEPLSTFSVDVDTASYSNMRRFLRDGQLPPAESVRIEELINYFSYDYPLPEPGKPVSMSTHLLRSPWNPNKLLLHVGLRTQPIALEDLPASNLTFLIDVSGSMNSPDKLPLVRQALQMLVRELRPKDHVALVVYAGAAGVVLPPAAGNQQQRILDAIGRLEAGGSTNGAGGIRLAYQIARQAFDKRGNNRVILATDGDFNVGVSSDDELVRLIEQERQSGVFLSVLGFGTGNLKDSKMEKLADHGNGNYAYIDSLSEARKVFVQQMGATLVTVAKDVKLQIEFNPAQVKEYRLVGYENRMLRPEDFNNDAKDAGDLGAGHQVTAFYEIVPANGVAGGDVDPLRYQEEQRRPPRGSRPNELAWLKLRHKAPLGASSELMQWPVSARVLEAQVVPRDVRFAAAVAEYGLLLRHSKFAGSASFDHALAAAANSAGPDLNGYRTEFVDLVRRAATLSGSQRRW